MNIKTDKIFTIFKNESNGKIYYKLNMSKKDRKEDKTIYGTINCRFKKDVNLDNKQKIKIKEAWLDFYNNNNNVTVSYVFINDFELVNE